MAQAFFRNNGQQWPLFATVQLEAMPFHINIHSSFQHHSVHRQVLLRARGSPWWVCTIAGDLLT